MVIYHAKLLNIRFSPNIYKALLGKKLTLADLKCTEEAIYESMVKVLFDLYNALFLLIF
jgi:hypothetical protein